MNCTLTPDCPCPRCVEARECGAMSAIYERLRAALEE